MRRLSATIGRLCHAMGVLPSTQPVATLGSSFILSSFDVACACCVPFCLALLRGGVGGGGMLVLGLGLGHAMLRYSVGVGLGVASVGAVVNFIWLWRGWCLVVSMWHQGGVVCRACGSNAVVGP